MKQAIGLCIICLVAPHVAAQDGAGDKKKNQDSSKIKALEEQITVLFQENDRLRSMVVKMEGEFAKKAKQRANEAQMFQAVAAARQSENESLRHQLEALSKELDLLISAGGDNKKEGQRGPEYKVLESLVGTFDAQVKLYIDPTDPKIPPKESKGVLTRRMVLGGNFLQESYKGEFFGSAFTGMGMIGFDANQKKYVNTWFDSMSTAPMILYGTYDADKKIFTMVGDDFDPMTKKKMKARDVLTIESADKQSFAMFRHPEGAPGEFKVMDISYTKRKAEKDK